MTYPPQQPGPYRPDPYGQQPPGPYGQQQPGPYGQFGQQPPKSRTGVIVAVVVVAVLVLGGIGVGVYVLTQGDDKGAGASGTGTSGSPKPDSTSGESKPTAKADKPTRPSGGNRGGTEADLLKTAEDYVATVNTSDEAGATEFTCDKSGPGSLYKVMAGEGDVVAGNPTVMNGAHGTVDITLEDSSADPVPLSFEFKDDAWCVAV